MRDFPDNFGIESDEYIESRIAKRQMTAAIVTATQTEPPHLVDVCVVNDQGVGIWHTIEPHNALSEQSLQGWDVVRRRYVKFDWPQIVDVRSNSRNYSRATQDMWTHRIRITNLQWDEDKRVRQSIGVHWRGKRVPYKKAKRVVI